MREVTEPLPAPDDPDDPTDVPTSPDAEESDDELAPKPEE